VGTAAVVIPTYNGEAHIEAALGSVDSQTAPPGEVVIVDDGSTDTTLEVLRDRGHDPLTAGHVGAPAARNRGRRALTSDPDYVLFLDQDDVLDSGMLRALIGHLDAHPAAGLAYCRLELIDEQGNLKHSGGSWPARHGPGHLGRPRLLPEDETLTPLVSILDLVAIVPSVSLLRLSVFDRARGWDERFFRGGAADTALAVEVALLSEVHYIPDALVRYRSHGAQESAGGERVRAAQSDLMAELRRRPEPALRQAFRTYDRQIALGRSIQGVLQAMRDKDPARAARVTAGAARRLVRSR
jgi:glycosyltransferase involved in cell wall biosynthesis